jgi:DNA-binding SARP family transcriptional activator/tetratricopeptide (TPR) repeat protein
MSGLKMTLFGSFQTQLHGQPITHFESDKVRALLAYLAVESSRSHRRETLAGLLWPDRPEQAAFTNLRHALSSLRKSIDDQTATSPIILVQPGTIRFSPESHSWLDVAEFDRLTAGCQSPTATNLEVIERLQNAVTLYVGDFLEGFSLKDSSLFEEWILIQREHYRKAAVQALAALASFYENYDDWGLALIYARRQVELEPLDETAHCQIMRLLALSGQRSAALRQFETCRHILFDELQVEPARETLRLYESIKEGEKLQPEHWKVLPQLAIEQLSVPFVAREKELAHLNHHLNSALAGHGRVVFITGEAGSGKTALAWEFARRAMTLDTSGGAALLVAAGNCNAFSGQGDPYLPFREILETLTGEIEARRASGVILPKHAQRLWAAFPDAIQALVETAPDLVGPFLPADPLILRASAFAPGGAAGQIHLAELVQRHRRATSPPHLEQVALFEQVTGMLQNLARRHPLLLLLDDLQWADSGSISLLFHLGRRLAGSRILIVGVYRPYGLARDKEGNRHPLETVVNEFERDYGEIIVDLSQTESRQFVDAYIDIQPNRLDPGFREMLYQHTEGNALFTVELLRGLQEQGDLVQDEAGRWTEGAYLDWGRLPARVEAVIAERIQRLPQKCQSLLATASVEGEEFTAEVVARLQGVAEMDIIQCLGGPLKNQYGLVRAQELQRVGRRRRSRYRFQHALFQIYLYNCLDPAERSRLHEAIGESLEILYAEQAPELAVQLAWHFEAAGLPERAVDYLLEAGNRAVQLSAYREAVDHFTHGIALLQSLPETRERNLKELNFQIKLFAPQMGIHGWAAPNQRRSSLNRMLELKSKIGEDLEDIQLSRSLAAIAIRHFVEGEFSKSAILGERLFSLSCQTQDPTVEVIAHWILGMNNLFMGELPNARDHLERAWALYDRDRLRPVMDFTGIELGVSLRGWQALVWWMLGFPERAWQFAQEMVSQAQALNHPMSLDYTLIGVLPVLMVLSYGRITDLHWLETTASMVSEYDRAFFKHFTEVLQGFVQVEQGETALGIARMNKSISKLQMSGIQIGRPFLYYLLAIASLMTNQLDQGLAIIEELSSLLEKSDNHYFLAGIHLLKGELLIAKHRAAKGDQGSTEGLLSPYIQEAEECFLEAIKVAKRQNAKSWELKSALSLARLWRQQGKSKQARAMLAEIYDWFTEGFEQTDLIEARALLEAL